MRKFLLVALLAAIATLFSGQRTEAAIRLTVSSGGDTVYFYADGNNLSTGPFDVGNFETTLETAFTNFPGNPVTQRGTLSQTFNIGFINGSGPNDLTAFAEIIEDVAGLSDGQITDAGQITDLLAADLAVFTVPAGPILTLESSVSVATNSSTTTGEAFTTSTANGTSLDSLTSPTNPDDAINPTIQRTNFPGTPNYTLTQLLTITGINGGTEGGTINASTAVTAVPAPAGLLLLAAGAPVLGLGYLRRRKAAE